MRLDLNLLLVLEALLSEGSVTRAARRLNLAQPTVSNALAKLREHFKDPLLERSGRSMKLTGTGRALLDPLRDALARVDRVVQGESAFDPRTANRLIRIATSDYVSAVVMPGVMAYLALHAPQFRLAIVGFGNPDPIQDLRMGSTDLLIGAFRKTSAEIHHLDLFTDGWACVVRKEHRTLRGRMTLKHFGECTHITVQPQHGSVGGSIDDILTQMSSRRSVALSLPHLYSAIQVVLASDVVLTLAARTATALGRVFPLQVMPHPLHLKPFVVSQLWHERSHADPAHAWFRKVLADTTSSIAR